MKYFLAIFFFISVYKLIYGTLIEEHHQLKSASDDLTRSQYGPPPPYQQRYNPYGGQPYQQRYNPYGNQNRDGNPYNNNRQYGGYRGGYYGYERWQTTTVGFPWSLFGKK